MRSNPWYQLINGRAGETCDISSIPCNKDILSGGQFQVFSQITLKFCCTNSHKKFILAKLVCPLTIYIIRKSHDFANMSSAIYIVQLYSHMAIRTIFCKD